VPETSRLKKLSFYLEISALVLALGALLFRATLYWVIPVAEGEPYGLGNLIDFALAMALFVLGVTCAAAGVWLSFRKDPDDHRLAFRPVLVGIVSFVGYYFLHPHVPKLL